MLNKAIEKIKAEIEQNKNNSNIQVVGEFLLEELALNNEVSEKVLIEGKTIKGGIEEMKKVAKAKAVDGCGMVSDQEGFGIVLTYYGIKFTPLKINPIPIKTVEIPVATVAQEKKPDVNFNVELDF